MESSREWKVFIRRWLGYISAEQQPIIAQALEELAKEFKQMGVRS